MARLIEEFLGRVPDLAQFFSIHPTHPQPRLIRRAAEIVRGGGLIAYPTDSCYALGCHLGDARAMRAPPQDPRHGRAPPPDAHVPRPVGDRAYANVDDAQFRLMKRATPGSYTFILRATREVPRRLAHPRRKTIGVRVPGHRWRMRCSPS